MAAGGARAGRGDGPPANERSPEPPVRALRAGCLAFAALAVPGRGRVASAHRRLAHLALADGTLVTLLPEGTPLDPWALTVTFDPATVAPDAEVSSSAGSLLVGPLEIALAGTPVAELRLRRHPTSLPADLAARLARTAPSGGEALSSAMGMPSSEPRTRAAEDLFDAATLSGLGTFQAGGGARELASLVGLGRGLTPSGDDVVVGVLAGLDLARRASRVAGPLRAELASGLAGDIASRTSRLSAQMLSAAALGFYAEPVLDVLDALSGETDEPDGLERAAARLVAMGHRSGEDTLRGIVAALDRVSRG